GGAAIGPGVAGLIVAGFGVQIALLLDAASFYAIAWILLTAGPLPQPVLDPGRLRDRVRAGLSYIRERAKLRRLLIAQGAAFIFFAAVIPVEVIYAKQTLGAGDAGYGLLLASWGGGMVLGSLIFAVVRRAPLPLLLLISTLTIGVGYVGIAAAPALGLACAASVLGGSGNGVQWVAVVSAVQELTSQSMQARVMSVLESIGAAMPGVGYLVGGAIAAEASPRASFLVAGLGVLAITVIAALLLGARWSDRTATLDSRESDPRNDIMVELIPGTRPIQSDSEVVS
ncbi:MAG: MFS transporter, partial [Trebonia sp.]